MTVSIQPTHLPIAPRSSPLSKPTIKSNFPITRLPTDILLTLFCLIPSPQTLSALSLCSRQFHHYVTPYLYSHFLHLGDTCTSLPHFLHTILHNPHYALYTKNFTCNALLGYKTDTSLSNFSPSDLVLLKSRLKSNYTLEDGSRSQFFGSHIASQWYNFILQGNWDAIVGLILCLLPNLLSLNIINHASGCPYGYPYLETVLNRAAKLQNQRLRDPTCIVQPQAYSFPHLRSLHLAKHDTMHYPRMGFEILRALPFLAIPSIREDPQIGKREGLEFSFNINHFLRSIEHLRDILEVLRLRVSESSLSSSSAEIHDGSEEEEEDDEQNDYHKHNQDHDSSNKYDNQRNQYKYNSIITQLSYFTKLEVLNLSANLLPASNSKTPSTATSNSQSRTSSSSSNEKTIETRNNSLSLLKSEEIKHRPSTSPPSHEKYKPPSLSRLPPCETCLRHAFRARETQVRTRRIEWDDAVNEV
ncbi:uncharacterized protein EAF01_003074 [Botrytis porri]|uniref:uncharacterized protein n=1 Tax=Botrytis porri TaxID=87229 RepID=UPI001900F46B|nr:uncharacterized protein EAF01_003074 [Botrytis porri]KAF7909356.1 hypothetical protein EAF01_003074 [Botrytis porri]